MTNRVVLCVVGTRPEAVKMAPVIRALKREPEFQPVVLATAQHRDLLDQTLAIFGITPDIDLNLMTPGQTLAALTARLLAGLDDVLSAHTPAVVLAQGDTTTVMAAAFAAFYRQIPFGHVEAGLRTGDLRRPFPEEMNRVVTARLARWHFAPTETARTALLAEGVPPSAVHLTGNTVIDALLDVAGRATGTPLAEGRRRILVTAHRREHFGAPFAEICRALRTLADQREDIEILYPVHPNPEVQRPARSILGGHPRIRLLEPLGYADFVAAMKGCHFILSDSGGVQEEAPALGKPVLVLRHETERPEAVAAGVARLVGPDHDAIVRESLRLLDDPAAYAAMSTGASPYGDGKAAGRIVEVLRTSLESGK
jgi:UDP-N-acetylglucosamine 2-epimerase (non-hydrolysing)